MSPKFKEITSIYDLLHLEKCLLTKLPSSAQMLNIVRLALGQRLPKTMESQIYKYEESESNPQDEELFVICIQRPNIHSQYCVITLAPENPTSEMLHTFDQFIDWEKVQLFSNVHESFVKYIQALCDKHVKGNFKGTPGFMYLMDIKKAEELPSSEFTYSSGSNGLDVNNNNEESITDFKDVELEIKPLLAEHAKKMIEAWKWAEPHSESQIEESIKCLNSTGLFVNSELASWVMLSPMGTINMLYTEEGYRRKGYGKLTMAALTKSLALDGIIPVTECEPWNDKSWNLIESIGFRKVFNTCWIYNTKNKG